MITCSRTDAENPDFQMLVKLLDEDLAIRDGEDHAFYDQFNKIHNIRHVVVCYVDEQPVACGAFKPYSDDTVEIKRMFVQPFNRGCGLATKVLIELEEWAAESGYRESMLETGIKQPEAIRLYQKAGYRLIKNYGQYENIETSVCMTKSLSGNAPAESTPV